MSIYKARQVEVSAIQFDGSNHDAVMDFMGGHEGDEGVSFLMGDTIYVSSKDGMVTGSIGDYVVKLSDADIYLYDEHIFNLTYAATDLVA